MALPKVSIVIPSYKASHFEQCLRSAVGQTYPNTEILVSDNCPTEDIRDICARFPQVIYQRCSVIRADNVISSFYSGKGEFVKPLFDDDLLHPFCVERMVAAMQSDPDVELTFSASQVVDVNNMRVETRRPYQVSGAMAGRDMHRSMTLGLCNYVGEFTTVMFRRATLWQIGWQQLFRLGSHDFTVGLADIVAYCNLVQKGKVFYIDEELSYFRRDPRLESNSNAQSNPNFGFCFSDYIDLAVASHATGVISTEELLAMQDKINSVRDSLGPVFWQVGAAYDRHADYVRSLP